MVAVETTTTTTTTPETAAGAVAAAPAVLLAAGPVAAALPVAAAAAVDVVVVVVVGGCEVSGEVEVVETRIVRPLAEAEPARPNRPVSFGVEEEAPRLAPGTRISPATGAGAGKKAMQGRTRLTSI